MQRILIVICFLLPLSSCGSVQPTFQAQLLGVWQTDLAGFPVVVEFTETTVGIVGEEGVPYTLADDVLTYDFGGPQSRRIEFPSADVMVHIDEIAGSSQSYTRQR